MRLFSQIAFIQFKLFYLTHFTEAIEFASVFVTDRIIEIFRISSNPAFFDLTALSGLRNAVLIGNPHRKFKLASTISSY